MRLLRYLGNKTCTFLLLSLWIISTFDYLGAIISDETTILSVNKHQDHFIEQSLCSRQQILNGLWVEETLPQAPYVRKHKNLRCPTYNQIPFHTWAWHPADTSCQWTRWNASLFCEKLAYATISIIGDSLSWEHYSSLLGLLGETVRHKEQFVSQQEERNYKRVACLSSVHQHGVKVIYRNDPYLKFLNASIQEDFPLVIVLNRGAHYVPDRELRNSFQQTILHLQAWQDTCQKSDLPCILFWRTTVPGHVDCQSFSQPVNDLEAMEKYVANHPTPYQWHQFQQQNQLVLQELSASRLQYVILDAYYLNILRPDGHRMQKDIQHQNGTREIIDDCLHNCFPGSMDIYSQLLLHYLRIYRSEQDVKDFSLKFQSYAKVREKASNEAITGR